MPSPPGGAGPAGLIAGRAAAAELLRGEFTEGVGTYGGEGTAIVSDRPDGSYTVRFADFRVSRGPDLHVWLVAHPNPQTNEDVLASKTLPLGPLKATSGAQAYPIPAGTDFAEYQSLVIWCKRVNALFSPAVLQ